MFGSLQLLASSSLGRWCSSIRVLHELSRPALEGRRRRPGVSDGSEQRLAQALDVVEHGVGLRLAEALHGELGWSLSATIEVGLADNDLACVWEKPKPVPRVRLRAACDLEASVGCDLQLVIFEVPGAGPTRRPGAPTASVRAETQVVHRVATSRDAVVVPPVDTDGLIEVVRVVRPDLHLVREGYDDGMGRTGRLDDRLETTAKEPRQVAVALRSVDRAVGVVCDDVAKRLHCGAEVVPNGLRHGRRAY